MIVLGILPKNTTHFANEKVRAIMNSQSTISEAYAHKLGLLYIKKEDDLEYLVYVLLGVDVILLNIIITFLWRKRHVFVTCQWSELLEI